MSPARRRARAVLEELERLRHHDALEPSDDPVKTRPLCVDEALGTRKLSAFGALNHLRLKACLSLLSEAGRDPDALAVRGRLHRLLGETALARRDFRRSLRAGRTARACGWLGETFVNDAPRTARPLLAEASRLDPAWAWPHFWSALVELKALRSREALSALDEFALRARAARTKRSAAQLPALARAQAWLNLGDFPRALEEARAAVRLDPSSPAGHQMACEASAKSGLRARALSFFHAARNLDAALDGACVLSRLFAVDVDWGESRRYLKALDAGLRRFPNAAVLYASRADLERSPELCRYEAALADCRKAVGLDPGCAWMWASFGRALGGFADGRAAIPALTRACELAPRSGWMRAWRGATYARLGEKRRALRDFDRAAALMPWYAQTYSWRGALLNTLGLHARARADLDLALRLNAGHAFSLYERFKARLALKDYPGAVADVNAAFRRDPKYSWLGGRPKDEAQRLLELEALDTAVSASPREPWLRAWRGFSRLQCGDPRRAVSDLERAVRLRPGSALIAAWLGLALRAEGRVDEAILRLKKAAAIDPGLWTPFQGLAEAYLQSGELPLALKAVSRAAELAPTTAALWALKAEIERRLGLRDAALTDVDKALALHRGFRAAKTLKRRIRPAAAPGWRA